MTPNDNGEPNVSQTPESDNPDIATEQTEDVVIDLGSADADSDDATDETEIDLGTAADDTAEDDGELNLDFGADEAEESDEGIDLNFGEDAETEDEEVEEDDDAESDDAEAALENLRQELRTKIGDWYVVHTYSGMENRVQQNLENRANSLNMEDYIFEVVVPTEDVIEIRNGAKKQVRRTVLPGYVLVRMELTDESWSTVRHTPSVTGFVGHATSPIPLSLEEVEKMLAPAVISAANANSTAPAKKKRVEVTDFAVGDSVMVVEGPFAGVHASITEINVHSQRLKASVEILGRETPVDLTFPQIQKV